jgi:transcription termination factor NusB
MLNKSSQNNQNNFFYEANYGDSRLVLYQIFLKYFDIKNSLEISKIFDEIIDKNSKEKNLKIDEYLQEIDDDFLTQIMVGVIENSNKIDNIISEISLNKFTFEFLIILKLIIFELIFLTENSSQKIYEEYFQICEKFSIKFDKKIIINLIEKLRNFEN